MNRAFSNWWRGLASVVAFTALVLTAAAGPKEDVEALQKGEKLTFDSKGHSGTADVRVKISYPKSWEAGERPERLQVLLAKDPELFASLEISIFPLGELKKQTETVEKKKQLFREAFVRKTIPREEWFVAYELTSIGGEPCGFVETKRLFQHQGKDAVEHKLSYMMAVGNSLILIVAGYGDTAPPPVARERFEKEIKPLLQAIVKTCTVEEAAGAK